MRLTTSRAYDEGGNMRVFDVRLTYSDDGEDECGSCGTDIAGAAAWRVVPPLPVAGGPPVTSIGPVCSGCARLNGHLEWQTLEAEWRAASFHLLADSAADEAPG